MTTQYSQNNQPYRSAHSPAGLSDMHTTQKSGAEWVKKLREAIYTMFGECSWGMEGEGSNRPFSPHRWGPICGLNAAVADKRGVQYHGSLPNFILLWLVAYRFCCWVLKERAEWCSARTFSMALTSIKRLTPAHTKNEVPLVAWSPVRRCQCRHSRKRHFPRTALTSLALNLTWLDLATKSLTTSVRHWAPACDNYHKILVMKFHRNILW